MNRRCDWRGRKIVLGIGLALMVAVGSASAQEPEPAPPPGPPGSPEAEGMAPQVQPPPEAPPPIQYDPNIYVTGPTMYPASLPPDPIPEYRPATPGYGFVWVNGYWDWTGYDWAWDNGYWTAPRPGWFYVGPRFVWDASGQPIYYRGYWQAPNGYRDYGYGGRGASVAWMGRPRIEPRYWRTQPGHSTAWRTAPGAPSGGWRRRLASNDGRRKPARCQGPERPCTNRECSVRRMKARAPARRPRRRVLGQADHRTAAEVSAGQCIPPPAIRRRHTPLRRPPPRTIENTESISQRRRERFSPGSH